MTNDANRLRENEANDFFDGEASDAQELRALAASLEICVLRDHFAGASENLRQIADRMETESKVASSKWIDVNDRLPEPREEVLVWAGGLAIGFVRICDIPKGQPDWVIVNYPHHRYGERVSHWKPIVSPMEERSAVRAALEPKA